MPYIDPGRRPALDVASLTPLTPGELNFVISRLLTEYVYRKGETYEHLSAARAAAQDASDEFYRRVVAPYEDEKCKDHGDVYAPLVPPPFPDSKPKPQHLHYWVTRHSDGMAVCACGATAYYDCTRGRLVIREAQS